MVERIDEDSAQLAAALAGEQARIIVTTLQKFPFIFDKIGSLPERTYAVIVDEAHSSQTGEAARELRRALGSAQPEIDADIEASEVETLLAEAVAARGRQPNLSFFAFTATPKGRTLELFGAVGASGRHEPFHLYPMRQAIEEGFIEDVLAGYLTYNQYFHLEKAILDDPEYDTGKARTALAKFVTLHPDNLAQKAQIIVEHFRTKIARQVGGKAKAMVVCSSRPHAVRMWEALRAYANNLGYDLGVAGGVLGRGGGADRVEGQRVRRVADRGAVRRRRLADHGGGREVPDRVRPAEAGRHVRGQDPHRAGGGANLVETQPHPSRQVGHIRDRLRERRLSDWRGVCGVPRQDRGPAHRSEPAVRHPPGARRLRHPRHRPRFSGRRRCC